MSETISLYAGVNKAAKMRRRALRLVAKRDNKSISDVIWDALRDYGPKEVREAIIQAELLER